MKQLRRCSRYLLGISLLAVIATISLSVWVSILAGEIRTLEDDDARRPNNNAPAPDVGSSPGLGEFMTTMQLHMGKVWFAGKASNWDLARYELDELREAMEAAQSLHVTKNGVDISKVLAAVSQSQISPLSEAVDKKNQSNFAHAYDEALSACNGCHEESGHRFIKITRPTAPPVTNQKWDVTG
jgi:hypothetical protein